MLVKVRNSLVVWHVQETLVGLEEGSVLRSRIFWHRQHYLRLQLPWTSNPDHILSKPDSFQDLACTSQRKISTPKFVEVYPLTGQPLLRAQAHAHPKDPSNSQTTSPLDPSLISSKLGTV